MRKKNQVTTKRQAFMLKQPVTHRKVSDYCEAKEHIQLKFKKNNQQTLSKKAVNAFLQMMGRNIPITYQQKFNFKEQWQMMNQKEPELQSKTSKIYAYLSTIRMLLMVVGVWAVSTELFFKMDNSEWIPSLLILISSIQIVKAAIGFSSKSTLQIVKRLIPEIILVGYVLARFLMHNEDTETSSKMWWLKLLGIAVAGSLYLKISSIYTSIKNYHISTYYRDFVDLFDLFMFLGVISHIAGLFLIWVAELTPSSNWLTHIGIQHRSWFDQYIYCLYFSSTTLLTVGYGDIFPTNISEIVAILLTQFIGIATFGYIVNQIGTVLANLRLKSESVHKELGTVQNLGKSYRLEPEILTRMRTQVINSKRLGEVMDMEAENSLLGKFTQDLREKIKFQSSLKVIKRSAFMLTNWTGNMQSKIARKLVKQIYQAEQILLQSEGKQKLYILDKGRIQIMKYTVHNYRMCLHKSVKTLFSNGLCEVVADNVYGYSSILSWRKVNLSAIAKQVSICYILKKDDLMSLLMQCEQDKQHFYQLKCLVDNSLLPESLQVPSIANIRQHYCPSTIGVVRKYKNNPDFMNSRTSSSRHKKKSKLVALDEIRERQTLGKSFHEIHNMETKFLMTVPIQNNMSYVSIKNVNYEDMHDFETIKNYEKYFKKGNVDDVIKRMKIGNYMVKSKPKLN